jgi:membrane protease YdiL (CAAX protease family)
VAGSASDPALTPRVSALVEVVALYLTTLMLVRGAVGLHQAGVHEVVLAVVPLLFMYSPVWLLQWRGVDSWSYPLAVPAFSDVRGWLEPARWGLGLAAGIGVPFVIGYHYWQTVGVPATEAALGLRLFPTTPALIWAWPSLWHFVKLVGYHFFFVAIPEEFFYRGYMQTRLDEAFGTRWRVLGTYVGPALPITCVLFAFGHSLVILQWWHVFIVFPSLAFGWLRARTGGVLAGAWFHAACNIGVAVLDMLYGIVPRE